MSGNGYTWGRGSQRHMRGIHPDLIAVLNLAITYLEDCDATVTSGVRSQSTQDNYVKRGVSKTRFSRHLIQSDGYGHAVDVVPWERGRIPWPAHGTGKAEQLRRVALFQHVADCMFRAADELGVLLQWGADWDMDGVRVDKDETESFMDMPHFEIPSPHEIDMAQTAQDRRETIRSARRWMALREVAASLPDEDEGLF